MPLKNKYKVFASFLIISSISIFSFALAEEMDVTANIPTWTYDHAIKIELTPSLQNAKTFYSFNPNWTPVDSYLYTWSILIKSSTPLIFFSFVNTKVESKIKQNDFMIIYPDSINLSWNYTLDNDKINWVNIMNNDSKTLDISYWEVKKDDVNFVIPDSTILNPWQTFSLDSKFSWTGYISLFAPDWEKKDFMEIIEIIKSPEIKQEIIPEAKYIPKKKIEISNDSIDYPADSEKVKSDNLNADINVNSENPDNIIWISENIWDSTSTTEPQKIETDNSDNSLNDNLKLSLNETKNQSNLQILFWIIWVLFVIWIIYQITLKRKKSS